jgi:hypothetical protein
MPSFKPDYLLARVARHFLPERVTRFLLLHSVLIKAGIETSDPRAAVRRYVDVLAQNGKSLKGKRVLVFGYGGRFDVAIGFLEAGAGHVVLCEKYAPPDDAHNIQLVQGNERYLVSNGGHVRPLPDFITLLQADIRDVVPSAAMPLCDYVVTSSVYEHLEDVQGVTRSLAGLTQADGLHIHYVDLRDHFFRYPFEMLAYSEKTWRKWLNPTSNHNRFRLWDYRRVFQQCFERVDIHVLARDEEQLENARGRIRSEFLSGDLEDDSVTLILVVAGGLPQGSN